MAEQWVPVFASTLVTDLQFALALLEEEGIPAVIVNKQDSMHLHLNTRSTMELHVRSQDVIQAKYILNKEISA